MIELKKISLLITMTIVLMQGVAQTCELRLLNTSTVVSDDSIYWAIIGQNPSGLWSYVNMDNGQLIELSESDNTLVDPKGQLGPGGHTPGVYANYFYKFSTHSSLNIPMMQGARIFISVGGPLYLYAFGGTGGYAGINLSNPNDPNQGILYEVIEFTYDQAGYHGNTTRVDEFSFPISMQVEGANNYNKIVGEYAAYQSIINGFKTLVPQQFQGCVKGDMIVAPGKADFKTGGSQEHYFDAYIDHLWSRYTNEDLVFTSEAGKFTGRVTGEVFTFYRSSDNAKAVISRKPTTIEILEGSGALAQHNGNPYSLDLVVQALFCAAVNRHVVENASWSKATAYYQEDPCNHYARYWHEDSIAYGRLAYGFCYDDVFSQSTLLESPNPTRVTIRFGGGGSADLTGGNSNGLLSKPNIGGIVAPCTGTDTTKSNANELVYTYLFTPSGNDVTITLTCLTNKTGLVSVIQNKTDGMITEKIVTGSSVSQTLSYPQADLITITGKWLFAGGDAFTKDFIYESGSGCQVVTDVADSHDLESFFIYPNPAREYIILNSDFLIYNFEDDQSIDIINPLGQSVFNSEFIIQNSKFKIDVSPLPAGIYFIKVGDQVQKFIKH